MDQFVKINLEEHMPLVVIRLEGHLARLEVYKFKAEMEKLIAAGARYLVVDIGQLFFLDSLGIGALVQTRNELSKWEGGMVLVGQSSQHVQAALGGSQMGRVIPTVETTHEAKQILRDKYGYRDQAALEAVAEDEVLATLHLILNRLTAIEARLDEFDEYEEEEIDSANP